MDKTLVILAAGLGSRYGGLKQMDPVGPSGEFILDYSLYDAIRAGFNKVVFLISHAIADDFKATIGRRASRRVAVDYAFQTLDSLPPGFSPPLDRQKPWGTAHATLSCRDQVNEPFAVINADDYYGRESYAVLSRFLDSAASTPSRCAMVGFVLRNTISHHGHVARGVCRTDPTGLLREVVEHTHIEPFNGNIQFLGDDDQPHRLSGDEVVSMNFWGLTPSIFPHLECQFRDFLHESLNNLKAEFFLPSAINRMVHEENLTVQVLKSPDSWFGVTYPQDKAPVAARIREFIGAGLYPSNLWA